MFAEKKSSLQRIIVQMKTIGEMKLKNPGPVCVNECKRPTNPSLRSGQTP